MASVFESPGVFLKFLFTLVGPPFSVTRIPDLCIASKGPWLGGRWFPWKAMTLYYYDYHDFKIFSPALGGDIDICHGPEIPISSDRLVHRHRCARICPEEKRIRHRALVILNHSHHSRLSIPHRIFRVWIDSGIVTEQALENGVSSRTFASAPELKQADHLMQRRKWRLRSLARLTSITDQAARTRR